MVIHRPFIRAKTLTITKFGTSFFIIRHKHLVFSVYYSGHINVTGVKQYKDFFYAFHYLKKVLCIQTLQRFSVDNITFTSQISKQCITQFGSFIDYLLTLESNNQVSTVKYSSQKFPGAFIKIKTCTKATIILFSSGKYNIVGCNTLSDLKLVSQFMQHIHT